MILWQLAVKEGALLICRVVNPAFRSKRTGFLNSTEARKSTLHAVRDLSCLNGPLRRKVLVDCLLNIFTRGGSKAVAAEPDLSPTLGAWIPLSLPVFVEAGPLPSDMCGRNRALERASCASGKFSGRGNDILVMIQELLSGVN